MDTTELKARIKAINDYSRTHKTYKNEGIKIREIYSKKRIIFIKYRDEKLYTRLDTIKY